MTKAYAEIRTTIGEGRKIGYRLEQSKRVNLSKMLEEYITYIFGLSPTIFKERGMSIFAFTTDDGGNVEIYTGDLKQFQERGLSGLTRTSISHEQLTTLKML